MGFYISDHSRNLYCVHGGAPLYSETLEAAKKRREEHGLADSKIVERRLRCGSANSAANRSASTDHPSEGSDTMVNEEYADYLATLSPNPRRRAAEPNRRQP